ncbi:MAG: RnfABCDGE type electron transport complex subunit D [Roseivivax sp.]|nr:RnfABCDGE type electron transport complex subunit D [Roseivivax sp.]
MSRGLWDRETVALLLLAALMPMAMLWLWYGGAAAFGRLWLALLVAGAWHLLFMLARAQPPSFAGALSALAIAMLAPVELGPLRLALGISFGVIAGELVFGGWGRNLVNPATVALAFLGFGFPAAPWPDLLAPLAWAAIPAALIGLAAGVMPAGVIGGALAAGLAAQAAAPLPPGIWIAASVALVLLVADPVASAGTRLGRWLNGALYGGLVILFAHWWTGAAPVQIAVAAALLASLTAPLLDEAAIALWLAQRRRRLGQS